MIMRNYRLVSLSEAANTLKISVPLIAKFIKRGLISTVSKGKLKMLTPYGIRRLIRVVDLYEKSYSTDSIEKELNH